MGSRFFIIFSVSLLMKSTVSSDWSIQLSKIDGSLLVLFTRVHWLARKWINISAFCLKSTNLFLWKIRGMHGIFLLKSFPNWPVNFLCSTRICQFFSESGVVNLFWLFQSQWITGLGVTEILKMTDYHIC